MSDIVTFRDRTYGADDLLTAIISLGSRDDSADFLIALPDALNAKGAEVLGEIVARGTPDQVSFAAAVLATVRGIPMHDLVSALQRDDVRDPDARARIGSQIVREIFDAGQPYDPWLRTQAGRFADYGGTLGPAFLLCDRAWAMAHLDVVLGGSNDDASTVVHGALGRLDPAGKKALAAELRAGMTRLPQSKRDSIELDLGDFGL